MTAQRVESELSAFVDSFANLVRSSGINEDSDEAKRLQARGLSAKAQANRCSMEICFLTTCYIHADRFQERYWMC